MSIQRRLLITYLLFSIVSMLLLGVFAYTRSRTALQNEIRENLEAQATTIMQQVDALMFERVENIYGWSTLELMQDVKIGDVDKRLTHFLSNLKLSYAGLYKELFAVYQGRVVASSDASIIGDQWSFESTWINLPIQHTSVAISKPVSLDDNADMLLSTPLSDAFSDAELGRLYARYDWMDIARLLNSAVGGTGRHALLVDARGVILSASSNYWEQDKSLTTLLDNLNTSHGTITLQNQSDSDQKILVGYDTSQGIRGLPALGWHVLVITPSTVAFAQVTRLLWTFILLLAMITLIASVLAIWVARGIAGPIQELTKVTRKVPAQLEQTIINVQGQGEVAELSRAFKKMLEELKNSRANLVRMTKLAAVGEMSAMLAHEVRNPLGILRSSAQLLERQQGLDDRGRTMLGYMITECDRIDHLVSNLLESARPRQPVFTFSDVNLIVRKVIDLTQSKADRKGISIKFLPYADVTMVECDQDQITQVILNLVLNAIQILPENGQITIETRGDEDELTIRIKDNGPGIPVEDRSRVFEPFVTGRDGGLGLGLAIVNEIIQMHNGSIYIESAPSGGAQFSIRLPQHTISGNN